jgi:integrase
LRKQNGSQLSGQTLSNALSLVRGAFEGARQEGLVDRNPAEKVRLPKGAHARTDEGWSWLQADEIALLLSDRELSQAQRSMLVVALYAGLRAGELCALSWRDVDLGRGVLHVRRSRKGPRKNGRTYEVPLLAPACDALKAWQAEAVLLGRSGPEALVWPARDGGMHALGYDSGLAPALARCGITRRIRFHDIRHTCASHLLQGTWAPALISHPLRLEEVKAWLDHSDIGVTQRYAHLAPDAILGKVVSSRDASGANVSRDWPPTLSHLRDLNSRPTVYETVALPLS